jgi:hypothetical protein
MHQYKIQYQKFLNTWVLAEVLIHADANVDKVSFVCAIAQVGYWLDDKTWLAPGCIQNVIVVA